jgi:O-antigen/teichoic acid export membrane protein
VDGKRELFEAKYRQLCHLTLGIGLIGGGLLLAFNRSVINLLAGEGFFPGDYVNIWFSVSLITIPLTGLFVVLVVVSGDMRNIAWIYLVKMILAVPGGYIAWKMAGMAGITAFFTLLPLIGAYYGYHHGGGACGTQSMRRTCAVAALIALFGALLLFLCGHFAAQLQEADRILEWAGRRLLVPALPKLALFAAPCALGSLLVAYAIRGLYSTRTLVTKEF